MSGAGNARPEDRATGLDRPFLLGITGPIGCGKSTAARMLGRLGGAVIDADVLAREVTAPGTEGLRAVRDRFGAGVLDASGALDRSALAAIVFADPDALDDLEAIVHPGVRRLVEAALARASAEGVPFVVIEAIKLLEGGLADRCDEVWLVTCSPDAQAERLRGRGMAGDDIERRIATQGADLSARLAPRVDRVIRTDGSLDVLRERVEDALADALAGVLAGLPIGDPRRPA